MRVVLITGTHGFLGRHTSRLFKKKDCRVIGVGHGHWDFENPGEYGIDQWIEADVDYYSLAKINEKLDCVIHCAGGSSVGYSVIHPLRDFHRTVTSSINILEYIRQYQPQARFIYPSSAAVYGKNEYGPIREDAPLEPVSPYGFHKKMVEDLCLSYSQNFGISTSIARFFSIYGKGLKKQLLWDACNKIQQAGEEAVFFGTGEETRDWIHVKDAARLLYILSQPENNVQIVNGGSGEVRTVREIIEYVACLFETQAKVEFNHISREGDPKHYWADIMRATACGWAPQLNLQQGLKEYVGWYREQSKD